MTRAPALRAGPILRTEEEAWVYLQSIVDGGSALAGVPRIRTWAKLNLTFWADDEQGVVTAPMMEALLEIQSGLNRVALRATEGTTNLRSLSEVERARYEVSFRVKAGSTKLDFNLQEFCEKLGKDAIGKMTGKQVAIIVVAVALCFTGKACWNAYLEEQKEITRMETQSSQTRDLLAQQKFSTEAEMKRFELLGGILERELGDKSVMNASNQAKRGVIKAASKVNKTSIAGTVVSPEVARPMARNSRAPSDEEVVTKAFKVVKVETEIHDGFRVRLRDVQSGEEFFASVRDSLVSQNDRLLIQEGEWSKRPIEARMIIVRRRGSIVSAMVAQVIKVT